MCQGDSSEGSSRSSSSASLPAPLEVLSHLIDVHCHPTDSPISHEVVSNLPIRMCAMATRGSDQSLVRELALAYPDKVIPCFGYHPWFSHWIAIGPFTSKEAHYRSLFLAEIPPEAKQFLEEQSATLVPRKVELTYDFWKVDEILSAILPQDLVDTAPHGYTTIGHIAHLNLRDEYLPYKHVIGQVILDKDKRVRTVVNKLDVIQSKFRVFDMELLAGEPDYLVQHSESDCKFTFDFRKVYWNSRLHTEHARLVNMFTPEDVIADVFAGVGPFALPAAKKGCGVLANDLNPDSFEYLQLNITKNNVASHVRVSCEDGKDFIRAVFARVFDNPLPPAKPPITKSQKARNQKLAKKNPGSHLSSSPEPGLPLRNYISHFAMNLPDSAILFLGAFRGVLSPANVGGRDLSGIYAQMPMVHCYCFTRDPSSAEVDIRERVEKELRHPLGHEVSYHHVRSVAPNKEMFCISFRLPREVAFAKD